MKLTTVEYSVIVSALKSARKAELKDIEYFSAFNDEKLNNGIRIAQKNAAEIDALLKKLDKNLLNIVIREEQHENT